MLSNIPCTVLCNIVDVDRIPRQKKIWKNSGGDLEDDSGEQANRASRLGAGARRLHATPRRAAPRRAAPHNATPLTVAVLDVVVVVVVVVVTTQPVTCPFFLEADLISTESE